MASRFYFHEALSPYSNLPTAKQSSLTSDKDAEALTINRSMDSDTGAGPQVQLRLSPLNSTSTNDYYFCRFVSHRIKQSSIAANTWAYNLAARENNANANFPVSGINVGVPINVYVLRPGSESLVLYSMELLLQQLIRLQLIL